MTAKIQPRLGTDRTRLETVIPLSTPYLVFLDPSDYCNGRCGFCPSSDKELLRQVGRKPQLMDNELFVKIINDLCAMPEPIKTLRMYADGEPLMHPLFAGMVAYAATSERFLKIDTTTNGLLLDYRLNDKLVRCGLDEIWISVPWGYTSIYREMVRDLYMKSRGLMKVRTKYILSPSEGLGEFMEDFEGICDFISVEHLAPCWSGVDVPGVRQDIGIYGQPVKEVQICPYLFYSLKINSDGTVSLCFLDWAHKMIIGDLKTKTFSEIWNGNELKNTRRLFLDMQRKGLLAPIECRTCGQLAYGAPDDIDQYAEEILGRLP